MRPSRPRTRVVREGILLAVDEIMINASGIETNITVEFRNSVTADRIRSRPQYLMPTPDFKQSNCKINGR